MTGRAAAAVGAIAVGAAALGAGCAPKAPPPPPTPLEVERAAAERLEAERARYAPRPVTRAERSGYRETSRYSEVMAFVDSLARLAPSAVRVSALGMSGEGRRLPLVVASRPAVDTPEEARRLGRPVVYVQANIHAGEVEGKEALLALLRDLALAPGPNVLDSLVLLAAPIYNADGNERLGPQASQRPEQNGPALVGQRANAQGLDLNRDYVKAEAPETRAALALFARWDPDAFVDLHTTNGSYHGYALTWSPPLHPSSPLAAFVGDTLLPYVQGQVRTWWGLETFPYGNFTRAYGRDLTAANVREGWFTYDHRPRFGTNYYGLRGRLAVLSEAYSHDPFERRVRATYAFVRELLSALAGSGPDLPPRPARAGAPDGTLAVASRLTTRPASRPVLAEDLAPAPADAPREPGVPAGLRRTGVMRPVVLPVYDRFEAVRTRRPPAGGWAIDPNAAGAEQAVAALVRHGVRVERLDRARTTDAEVFGVDSVVVAAQPFQGHREVRLVGGWREALARALPPGTFVVRSGQPADALAVLLLDPESDDGLVTWNVWDAALRAGGDYPVLRLPAAPF